MPVLIEPRTLDGAGHRPLSTRQVADGAEAHQAVLLDRARFLDPAERALLEMRLARRLPVRQIAALLRQNPGVISRRVRSITARLLSPTVAALVQPRLPIDESLRHMALDHFLNRRRIDVLAARHGLTPAIVRKKLQWVRGWVKGRRDGAYAMHLAMVNSRKESDASR